jgi:APA family basic amino acid/polyamine antiporter
MIAYTGIETISNMAEEAKDAERTVPNGAGLVVLAVLGLYALLPIVALSAMPVTQDATGHYTTTLGTTFADDPVLGIVENLGLSSGLTDVLRYYVGVLAAVILTIATNAGMIGLSRLTFSMGHYRQLPERLRQIHPKFHTPYVAILAFSGVAALTILPGELDFLATMYSFGAMLSFTVAHVAVVRLRQRYPDRERPWKPPLNVRIRGTELPVSALLGGLGTFAAWIVVMALNVSTLIAGIAWMAFGITVYLVYRRRQGLPLRETVKVASLAPLGVEEVEYKSVLLVFEDGEFSKELVATARALAAKRRRAIHVLSLVNVPTQFPLDARLPEEEARAQGVIERAKLMCGQRVSGEVEHVRPGQAGAAVVEEAKAIDAAVILMPIRYRSGKPLLTQSLRYVLANRPTRVIVGGHPGDGAGEVVHTSVARPVRV